jgi:hypothetical protein
MLLELRHVQEFISVVMLPLFHGVKEATDHSKVQLSLCPYKLVSLLGFMFSVDSHKIQNLDLPSLVVELQSPGVH